MKREVFSRIVVSVTEPATLVFSVAVAADYRPVEEHLDTRLAGAPLGWTEVDDLHGTRLHRVEAGVGELVLEYAATIDGRLPPAAADEVDLIRYTRPSRYAESDSLAPTAAAEFAGLDMRAELLAGVSSWVGTRLAYVSGSSLPTDGAVRTLLARQGVCRDFAHVCVALLRGLDIPTRLVSVYAAGLKPMDFHAVAEAWVDDAWRVVDATALAPRESLVRIATGRDAADTAFLSILSGQAELVELDVAATADPFPPDDMTKLVSIG
ncbi:MAG: transglutaminase family protein [Candidatus Limnocylindrales bacterium]